MNIFKSLFLVLMTAAIAFSPLSLAGEAQPDQEQVKQQATEAKQEMTDVSKLPATAAGGEMKQVEEEKEMQKKDVKTQETDMTKEAK